MNKCNTSVFHRTLHAIQTQFHWSWLNTSDSSRSSLLWRNSHNVFKTRPSYTHSAYTFELAYQTKQSFFCLPKTMLVRKEKSTSGALQGWTGVANQHQLEILETKKATMSKVTSTTSFSVNTGLMMWAAELWENLSPLQPNRSLSIAGLGTLKPFRPAVQQELPAA